MKSIPFRWVLRITCVHIITGSTCVQNQGRVYHIVCLVCRLHTGIQLLCMAIVWLIQFRNKTKRQESDFQQNVIFTWSSSSSIQKAFKRSFKNPRYHRFLLLKPLSTVNSCQICDNNKTTHLERFCSLLCVLDYLSYMFGWVEKNMI